MTTLNRIQMLKKRFSQLEAKKHPWINHYQLISEYVRMRKQNFNNTHTPGDFLTDRVLDSTATQANQTMASSLIGGLWSSAGKAFRITRPRDIDDTADVKAYYEFMNDQAVDAMDHPLGGLPTAMNEYMLDQGAFGTSGIGIFENEDINAEAPIIYQAWDAKGMILEEGPNGFIDTIYNKEELTVFDAVKKHGVENLGTETQDKFFKGNLDDKIEILHVLSPRSDRNPFLFGVLDMPVASIHIEWKTGKIIRESGFEELPVAVTRFYKAMGEVMGRSPAMAALPDIIELNAVMEAVTIATEKSLDPPLAVLDDGKLGGGVIDTSAGALNVFKATGRIDTGSPITPLFTVGDISPILNLVEGLQSNIKSAFLVDRLLDFNTETTMTAFETNIRDKLRGQALGSVFTRQEAELFTPLITRTVNILLKKGLLGVIVGSVAEQTLLAEGVTPRIIPESVAKKMLDGEKFYDIKYISSANRATQAEEIQSILTTFDFAVQSVQVAPEALDNIDIDAAVRLLAERTGAPESILRSSKSMEDLRGLRQEQQEQAQQLDTARQVSEVTRNNAQAQATLSGGGGQQ